MATFPTLSSGSMKVLGSLASEAMAMYPATLRQEYQTKVLKFANDTEQRWVSQRELFSCSLDFHSVNGFDFSIILAFFKQMRGQYLDSSLTNVFDITLGGVNYHYCVFDQDSIPVEVDQSETYRFQLNVRQVRHN